MTGWPRSPSRRQISKTLLIRYVTVAKIFRLNLINFFLAQNYLQERRTIFITVRRIDPNVLVLNNVQSTTILLYGNENLDKSMLDATMKYLIETFLMHSFSDAL